MKKNGRDQNNTPCRSWLTSVIEGIVACLLSACLLGIGLRFCFPEIFDGQTHLIGLMVWAISLTIGGWVIYRSRNTEGQQCTRQGDVHDTHHDADGA